jgi:hypothetical protein
MDQDTNETGGAISVRALEAPRIEIPKAEAAPDTDAFKPRVSRAVVLGVSIAIAAALGSVVGALAGVALMRGSEPPAPTVNAAASKGPIAQLNTEIAALKASVEAAAKAAKAQVAQLAERVERAEKASSDAAKLARLAEGTEKKSVTPETTGSIVEKQQQRPPIVEGWVLRDIFDGRAMIESRYGLYEVTPGSNIPGLGRIEHIKRQDWRWVVVTPRGLIVSSR